MPSAASATQAASIGLIEEWRLVNQAKFHDNFQMKKFFLITIALALSLSGCSSVRSVSAEDFTLFYSDIDKSITTADLKSRKGLDNQETLKTYISDYAIYSSGLDEISKNLLKTSSQLAPEQAQAFKNAAEILSALSEEFTAEGKYIENLGCPLVWDYSKKEEIEECGRVILRWSSASARAIECSFFFASLEFQGFPEFDLRKVLTNFYLSEKELTSCKLFRESNSLYGYPRNVGVTWIPDIYQTRFLDRNQTIVVEIDEGLYAEGTYYALTDSLYGSWNGSCAVYRRYERLLLENDFLLGSIKNGTCY